MERFPPSGRRCIRSRDCGAHRMKGGFWRLRRCAVPQRTICCSTSALQGASCRARAVRSVWLSRTAVQLRAQEALLSSLSPGDIIPAAVTHLEPFGAFVDIGCGLPSLIGIENLSVSRIYHPSDRLTVGQSIRAAVRSVDVENRRITLTHRELLGTWEENAALFAAGETVRGIVRSVEPYGVFIELAPNLSGLAENREGLTPGTPVSVYIKSILPQRMKIKLSVIDILPHTDTPEPPRYFVSGDHIDRWVYTPADCDRKYIATEFL